jgi:hypothetical protein
MTLPDNDQSYLRQSGVLKENEVVSKEGDLYVATDVLTGARRLITIPVSLLENLKRRVLRD